MTWRSTGMRTGTLDGALKMFSLSFVRVFSWRRPARSQILFNGSLQILELTKMAYSRKELEKLTDHLFQLMFVKSFKVDAVLSRSTRARGRRLSNNFQSTQCFDIIFRSPSPGLRTICWVRGNVFISQRVEKWAGIFEFEFVKTST